MLLDKMIGSSWVYLFLLWASCWKEDIEKKKSKWLDHKQECVLYILKQ